VFTGGMNFATLTEVSCKVAKNKEIGCKNVSVHCTLHMTRQKGACK
jgi:hypothetical protein